MSKSTLKPVWDMVKGWATQNARKYQYVAIPAERTDVPTAADPLEVDASYFRLWLCELFLGKSRAWFTDWYPAVQSSVQLRFGSERVTLSHVAQAPHDALSKGMLLNYALTELVPYRGGTVELEAALLALKGANYLGAAVKALEGFSTLVAAPLGTALQIAEHVASGMEGLMQAAQGEVHLGLHQTFTDAAGGGKNILKPGYFAVILATADEVAANQLYVRQDRLYRRASDPVPFTGYDYMLFRIEGRQTRPDWRLKNIEQPLDAAIKAYLHGEDDKADAYKLVALEAVIDSPDLARQDRRRVSQAIYDELAEYRGGAHGAIGEGIRTLDQIVAARSISLEMAAALPDITLGELLGDTDRQTTGDDDESTRHHRDATDMLPSDVSPPPPPPPPPLPLPLPSTPPNASVTSFKAFPAVDAPEAVAPEAQFDVTVGFRTELDPHLTNVQPIDVADVKPGDRLLVTLDGDGVNVLGAFDGNGAPAPGKSCDTLPLEMNAQCKFKCQVQAGASAASVSAKYFYGYQLVGMATRSLHIVGNEEPAPAPTRTGTEAPVPAPASVPESTDNEAHAPAAAGADEGNPCRMQVPPPKENAVDLQVFISQLSGGGLQWRLVAPTPPTNVSWEGKTFDEKDAREFAHRVIVEMNASGGGVLGANAVEAMGQSIADIMPDKFFEVLREVYLAIGKRTPTVLLLLERESYVPWELALLSQPLDPTLPHFLGAQAVVGRWIQHDKIVLPPPVTLDLNKMTVVAGSYGGTNLPALKHALDEQAALHAAYAADECEATRAEVDLLVSNKTAGHLVHFVVHGTSDPAMNDQALLLTKGQIRSTQLMGSHSCGEEPRFAFIFLNACQVGTAGSNLGQAAGFPGDVIRGGAAGFIGPLWSVRDDIASQWAQAFYDAALAQPSRPIGEIMREQRKGYQPGADNTPLAYLYYGHPNMRLHRRWQTGVQP